MRCPPQAQQQLRLHRGKQPPTRPAVPARLSLPPQGLVSGSTGPRTLGNTPTPSLETTCPQGRPQGATPFSLQARSLSTRHLSPLAQKRASIYSPVEESAEWSSNQLRTCLRCTSSGTARRKGRKVREKKRSLRRVSRALGKAYYHVKTKLTLLLTPKIF